VVTGAGIFGVIRLWHLSLLGGHLLLVPVAAVFWAWGVLVYARLLGRLGWTISQLQDAPRKRLPRPAGKLKPSLRKQISVSDPWAAPAAEKKKPKPEPKPKPAPRPVIEDDEDGPATPYGLTNDPLCRPPQFELIEGSPLLEVKGLPASSPTQDPEPPLPRAFADDEDGGEIRVAPEDVSLPAVKPTLDVTPSALDLRLVRSDKDAPPAYPMLSGVFNFPFYLSSLRSLVILSLCWVVLGGWVEVLIILFPFK
jgi:hypothetical protein